MTPVACRVSDREENGFVFLASLLKGLFSPGMPVHGIMSVLLEIGAFLRYQTIGLFTHGARIQTLFLLSMAVLGSFFTKIEFMEFLEQGTQFFHVGKVCGLLGLHGIDDHFMEQ